MIGGRSGLGWTLGGIVVLAVAGCAITDPYERAGVWRPSNANEANLRAMVAQPADLARGVGSPADDGRQAAAALDRQRLDKPRMLPESAIAKVVPISGGSGDAQASP
jgi:hypothetical protein